MSKSSRKKSILARTLVLVASLFASGSIDKAVDDGNRKSQHASGMGRDTGAIFSPKRTKFKGYMRNKSSFNKNR